MMSIPTSVNLEDMRVVSTTRKKSTEGNGLEVLRMSVRGGHGAL